MMDKTLIWFMAIMFSPFILLVIVGGTVEIINALQGC